MNVLECEDTRIKSKHKRRYTISEESLIKKKERAKLSECHSGSWNVLE